MFLGEYLHIFDSKNRISIPSKFRKDLGRVVVVTRGLDHCLYVYSRKAWEKEARVYAAEVNGTAARRGLARLFLAGSAEAEVDGSGRVLIPDYLRDYAGLRKEVIVAGVGKRLEIWDAETWSVYKKDIEKNGDQIAEKLGEIGMIWCPDFYKNERFW